MELASTRAVWLPWSGHAVAPAHRSSEGAGIGQEPWVVLSQTWVLTKVVARAWQRAAGRAQPHLGRGAPRPWAGPVPAAVLLRTEPESGRLSPLSGTRRN